MNFKQKQFSSREIKLVHDGNEIIDLWIIRTIDSASQLHWYIEFISFSIDSDPIRKSIRYSFRKKSR